jgi:hypothetical protein
LTSIQSELDSKTSELSSLRSELDSKTSQMSSIQSDLDSKTSQLTSIQSELDTKTSEVSSLRSELDTKTSDLSSVKSELSSLRSDVDSERVKVAAELASKSDYKALYDSKSNEVILIRTEYEDKIKLIKDQYEDALKQVEECRKQIVDQNQSILDGINKYKESVKDFISSKDLKIQDLERIHAQSAEEQRLLQEKLDALVRRESEEMKLIESNKDLISDYDKRLGEKSQRVLDLESAIEKIQNELSNTKQELSKTELQNQLLQGYQNRCKEKVIKDKDQIINAIKDYNKKWLEWLDRQNVDVTQYKKRLLQEFAIAKENLQKVLQSETERSNVSNKEIQRLKQNITDVETALKKTINEQLSELSAKDEVMREKDSMITDLQSTISNQKTQVSKMESEISRLQETNRRIPELQKELQEVRRLLEQNRNTPVETKIDFDNCYSIVSNFASLNNIFYRKQEIIKKLDDIISNNLGSFSNLNDEMKQKIRTDFERVKKDITNHIRFLNLPDYVKSPNFEYLKSKSTRSRVPESYCKDLSNLLDYWNVNRVEYRQQDQTLTNIYEDLAGAVRIYIRIKPLVGKERLQNTVTIDQVENKRLKSLSVDCSADPNTIYKKPSSFGEFYGIFEEDYSNLDIYTGQKGTVASNTNSLIVNTEDIIESSETISPGLYSTFKQVEDGYSIVIFGYGLSGSGKTHTLIGSKGVPGILHYGLANLQGVSAIKLKYLFEQYYDKINFNNRQVSGKIHNLVGKIQQLKEVSRDETTEFQKRIPGHINISALRVEDIYAVTDIIEQYRIEQKRIKKTPNNPVSSRSHLYFVFEITFTNGKTGYVTIVDTAGRESPVDIFNTFIDTTKTTLPSVMAPAPVGGISNIQKNMKDIHKDQYTPSHIFDVLNEGFYVNETINHLIYYFNIKNGKIIKTPKQSVDERYNVQYKIQNYFVQPKQEMVNIDGANNVLMIPILKFLDNLSTKTKDTKQDWKPTKFITICCIRQELNYCDQTMETVQFAQNVKST